jgi:hypothetical protein
MSEKVLDRMSIEHLSRFRCDGHLLRRTIMMSIACEPTREGIDELGNI